MFKINKHFIIQPMHNIHYSVARGPKLLSMYTVEEREFLVRKYWQTGSFKACQTAFRMEMVKDVHHRSVASRNWLKCYRQGEADITPADFFLWGLLKGKVYKNTPRTQRRYTPRDSSRQRRHFGKKYSRIWRNAFKCAWIWKETSFNIDFEQVLFCIIPGMCIKISKPLSH